MWKWHRRTACALVAAGVVCVARGATAAPGSGSIGSGRRPNVILILADDIGYGDLHALGNLMIRTPNLDRLQQQSARLRDFHVDPTCAPSRAALMTGRYSSRTGVWHTIMGRSLMRRDETTMAEIFAANGYRTAIFGKWHLGDNYPLRPQDRGFQEVLVHGGGGVGQTPDYWGNDYFDDTYFHNGRAEKATGYCTDVWFDNAAAFIEQNKDRAFFLYIATNAAHEPYRVPPSYAQPYLARGVPQPMANFYGMITNLDENVGRLTAQLERSRLAEDTILVFLTDNGTSAGVAAEPAKGQWAGFNMGMRGIKGSQYDGGHRVPCFIRWPRGLGRGRDVTTLSAHIDLLPTLLDLTGLRQPSAARFDGASLAPLLRGRDGWPERTLFVHSQRIDQPVKWRQSAVMTDRWRLVDGRELYDIRADPSQAIDRASGFPDVVARLRQAYDVWWNDVSRRFDEYVPIVVGSAHENPTALTCHDWHGDVVPWNQDLVKQRPVANGFWVIDVERAGDYEITLRQQPAHDPVPLVGQTARLQIDDLDRTQAIGDGDTAARFRVGLQTGQTRLQTWITEERGASRGAYFVEVHYLGARDTH